VPITGRDELGQLGESINGLMGKIHTIVVKVRESSLQLLSVASEIAATARDQEQTVQNLSSSTTQVAASVREISATGKDLSGTMNEVNASASHACRPGHEGPRQHDAHGRRDEAVGGLDRIGVGQTRPDPREGGQHQRRGHDHHQGGRPDELAEHQRGNRGGEGGGVRPRLPGGRREIRRLADQTAVATLDIETMVRQMQDASGRVMQMDKFADEVRHGVRPGDQDHTR